LKSNKIFDVVREIWTGKASKKVEGYYLVFAMGLYFLGMLIAILIFPGNYTIFQVYVSYLGSPIQDSTGHLVYNIMQFCSGILMIPHFFYLYRQFQPTLKVINMISCFFGIVGAIGWASISINYQDSSPIGAHGASTWVAFGGIILSIVLMFFIFLTRLIRHETWPRWYHPVILYGEIFLVLFIMVLFTSYSSLFDAWHLNPGYFQIDHFWEYIEVFLALAAVFTTWAISK
jgi:hypothetical protein